MFRRSSIFVLASVLVAVGCDDAQNPAGPPAELPAAKISDGRFAGGNDDFFFLPPLLPNPQGMANYDAGAFNAKLGPTVSVCRLAGNPVTNSAVDCALGTDAKPILVANFSSAQVSVGSEQYHVNWHTDDSNLELDKFYRLQVFLGSVRLGFADIDPVSSGKDLKNANTGEVIPLVDGRTLPVKFRIENGALCTNKSDCAEFKVTATGGTFVTNTADAGVRFAAGALPAGVSEITLKIERVPVGADNRCHGDQSARLWREFEGCYQITSDPDLRPFGGLQDPNPSDNIPPAIVGQCVEVSTTDALYDYLQPYKSHPGEPLQRLRGTEAPFLQCDGFNTSRIEPSNPVLRFAAAGLRQLGGGFNKVFGVRTLNAIDLGLGEELGPGMSFSRFSWAVGLEAETNGDEQTTGFGLPATRPLAVHIKSLHFHSHGEGDEHPEDVANVPVLFTVTEGDGYFALDESGAPVRTRQVLTNENGQASIGFTAASNSPTNLVTAASPTFDVESAVASYAVAGLPPDLVIEGLQRTPAAPTVNDPLTWSFVVRNAGQGVAIPSIARVVVSLEEEGTETVASYDIPVPRLLPGATAAVSTPALAGPHDPGDHSVMLMVNGTEVVVESSDANNTSAENFTIAPATTAVSTLIGSVLDARTGAAIPGATVAVVGADIMVVTDARGEYRITGVQPGTYTLTAGMVGYQGLSLQVVATGGQIVNNFQLVPEPAAPGLNISQGGTTFLSMETGSSLQLTRTSEGALQWLTTNSDRISVTQGGLVTALIGATTPNPANEVLVSATDCITPSSIISVNSMAIGGDPPITLVWKPVPGAASYTVTVEWSLCEGSPLTCTNWGSAEFVVSTAGLSHTVQFSRFGAARWRVEARSPAGAPLSTSAYSFMGFLSL